MLRELPRAVRFGRFTADPPGGSFAFVMATGIVSIAAAVNGLRPIAHLLFAVNLVAFPALLLLLLLRLWHRPAAVLAELRDHRRLPGVLTIVVGACALVDQLALLTPAPVVEAVLWIGAAAAWIGLNYLPISPWVERSRPPPEIGLDGSWLLVVVAPQALSISASRAGAAFSPPEPILFISLCLFALGAALYFIVLMPILYRWLHWPMRADEFAPSYWINMGAAAISALAAAHLLPLVGADPVLSQAEGFVIGGAVLFWSLATWWIPLLCALTLWRCLAGTPPALYRLEYWSVVFPLGMYATASWTLAHDFGLPFLRVVPQLFVWVAVVAWCLVFAGMVGQFCRWYRDHRRCLSTRPPDQA